MGTAPHGGGSQREHLLPNLQSCLPVSSWKLWEYLYSENWQMPYMEAFFFSPESQIESMICHPRTS